MEQKEDMLREVDMGADDDFMFLEARHEGPDPFGTQLLALDLPLRPDERGKAQRQGWVHTELLRYLQKYLRYV